MTDSAGGEHSSGRAGRAKILMAYAEERAVRAKRRATHAKDRAARLAFGDDVGVLLFLVAMVTSVLTWRIGFFITDNWTLANAFVAVADGHLHVDSIRYGPAHGRTPGMEVVDDRRYAFNYGQLIISLPLLWLLWAVAAVADPAVAIVATFGLLVLATFVRLGRVLGREAIFSSAGVVLSVVAVAANLPFAVELRSFWFPLVALQLTTALAASLAVVVLYRLFARMYGRRIGAVGGIAVALASPIPFWATVPKRHSLTALLAAVSLYYFYRSREASGRDSIRWHALAYVPVGLLAWVNPAEGLVLLGALVLTDVLTVPRPCWPRIAAVGAATLASLCPFVLTNWLVTGGVLTPPRMATLYVGPVLTVGSLVNGVASSAAIPGPTESVVAAAGQGSTLDAAVQWTVGVAKTAVARLQEFLGYVRRSRAAASDPGRLYRIFVRRGYVTDVDGPVGQVAISLSVLESMPLLGGLLAVPVAVARGLLSRFSGRTEWSIRHNPTVAADLFVCWFLLLLAGLYLSWLPHKASWTVRYLHPLYPLGVYVLLRNPAVRDPIVGDARLLAVTYVGVVLAGLELFVLALAIVNPTLGEAVQIHALVALATGGLLAVWSVVYTAAGDRFGLTTRRWFRRSGTVLLAVCAAATTILLVLWAVAYFPHSQFALPALGEFSDALPFPS